MTGPELLAVVVKRLGAAKVAKRVGVTEGTVRHAVAGRATPRTAARERIRDAYGIPLDAWKSLSTPSSQVEKREVNGPSGVLPKRSHGTGNNQVNTRQEPASSNGVSPKAAQAMPSDADDPKANAIATLRILRMALERAEPEQIPSLANAVTSSSRLLARLSGQLEVTEAQILRSAPWARLVALVRGVLEQHPEASKALDKALFEYEGA